MKSLLNSELRESLRLGIPLAGAQVAQAATGFIDTIMMGWLGKDILAAGGLAATSFMTILVAATGVVTAVSPLAAEAYGAGDKSRIQEICRQGCWVSIIASIPLMLLLTQTESILRQFGQATATATLAQTYINPIIWGFFPALAFAMLRNIISALSKPQIITIIIIIGTIVNSAGNYLLGFGKFGFPNLGLAGLAWASTFSQWIMLISLVVYILTNLEIKSYRLLDRLYYFNSNVFRELVFLGLPISIAFSFEIGLFSVTTYLIGTLGTDALVAHQVVFQTVLIIFMIPLGISFGTTIRVGQWYGKKDLLGVKRAALVGMFIGFIFMSIMAVVLLAFPKTLISIYLNLNNPENKNIIPIAISLFNIVALSQIVNGIQTNAAGALRGLQDTVKQMLLSIAGFWGIGLFSGYLLAFNTELGGKGLYIGQFLGIVVATSLYIWRFYQLTSKLERK
jgi:multidrug resistance protein, MATE family